MPVTLGTKCRLNKGVSVDPEFGGREGERLEDLCIFAKFLNPLYSDQNANLSNILWFRKNREMLGADAEFS